MQPENQNKSTSTNKNPDTMDEHQRHQEAQRHAHAHSTSGNGDRQADKHDRKESDGHGNRHGDGHSDDHGDSNGEGEGHDDVQAEPLPEDLPEVGTFTVLVVTIVFLALLAGLFFVGWIPEHRRLAKLRDEAAEAKDAKPVVTASSVKRQTQSTDLVLPGNATALQQTSIYPRTNGYLKKQYVDIGDKVEAGQLLAEIDTPEIDAQLAQAKAAVAQSQANVNRAQTDFTLAQSTLDRYASFAKTGGVTQQQLDEKTNAFTQSKANLEAASANLVAANADVQRYEALQGFEKVTAPFSGTITSRGYDIGALLSSNNTSGKEMFGIAQTDTLRIFVSVPQAYATIVKVGQAAEFEVRNYPGTPFKGSVTRSADSLDPSTRTVRYQVDFNNREALLYPGMYGQIRFRLFNKEPSLVVPSSALVFDAKGLRVAMLDDEKKVTFKTIVAGRDYGTEIEVLEGLKEGETIVSNPGEQLADGVQVDVAKPQAPQGAPAPSNDQKSKTAAGDSSATDSKIAANRNTN